MRSKRTLLERARTVSYLKRTRLVLTDEWVEASLAWVKGEISLKQLSLADSGTLKRSSGGNALYRVAVHLREAYRRGQIKIVGKP